MAAGGRGSDMTAQLDAMGSVGTLFAIVDRLATSTAAPEWALYRTAKPGQTEREPVEAHAALDLWTKPNDFFSQSLLIETCQQHYDLVGECYWIIARDARSKIPLELWPIRPDRMQPVPSPTDYLAGWVYTGPDGDEVPLGLDDVIQIRRPNPTDPYRGIGPVQTLLADLEGVRLSAEWNRNFFRNSAEPGGIIKVDRSLTDDEFDELRARWSEQHRGVANAHRVAILEAGEWVDRKYTQRDMQFTELRTVASSVIREAYGMPKFAVGLVDDVNRASAEASATWFAEQMTVPRLRRIREALNTRLLPLYGPSGEGVEFDYEDPVPANQEADNADRQSRVDAFVQLVANGVDPTDAMRVAGLPDMAMAAMVDGSGSSASPRDIAEMVQKIYLGVDEVITWQEARQVLVDAGMSLDLSVPQPVPLAPAPTSEPEPASTEPAAPGRRGGAAARLDVTPPGQSTTGPCDCGTPVLRNETEDQPRQDWEDRLDDLLDAWADDVTPDQVDQLVDQVETIVTSGGPADLAGLACTWSVGAELLGDAMLDQADAAARRTAKEAADQGVSISPVTPIPPADNRFTNARPKKIVKYLEGLAVDLRAAASVAANLLASGLSASAAREALRTWSPGATPKQVGKAVRSHLDSLTDATLRTELGGQIWAAENEGRFATMEQAIADGRAAAEYTADEAGDSNTCAPCREVNGKTFKNLEAAQAEYPFGGYRDCLGRARCRGTIRPNWDPDRA